MQLRLVVLLAFVCASPAFACDHRVSPYVPWPSLLFLAVLALPPSIFALRLRGAPGSVGDLLRACVAAGPLGCVAAAAASAVLDDLFWRDTPLPWGARMGQELSAGAITVALVGSLLWARRRAAHARAGEDQALTAVNTRLGAT